MPSEDSTIKEIKYLDAYTFSKDGYLQEANRSFFHPLGLALELDPKTNTIRIWDYREDPEGIIFDESVSLTEKAERLQSLSNARRDDRVKRLGFWQQPIEPGK